MVVTKKWGKKKNNQNDKDEKQGRHCLLKTDIAVPPCTFNGKH